MNCGRVVWPLPPGPEADAAAIARDWNAVGQLFDRAMGRFEEEAGPTQTG